MKPDPRTRNPKGFALVVTLSLMILLTIIAVGLLTLSSIALRTTTQDSAANTARANARMALMLALGELQATMGPDQRVSAPASSVITGAQQPHLTGVWESWRWEPKANQSPDYGEKSSKFRRWLISTADDTSAESISYPGSPAPTDSKTSVLLVDSHKKTKNSNGISTVVRAGKVSVQQDGKTRGKYAWAVFDDSVKAPIHLEDPKSSPSAIVEAASRNAPYRVRADALDPANLDSLKDSEKLYTLESAGILVGPDKIEEIRGRFHDFTTGSIGLLTDTANGGLKTDLSSLFEDDKAKMPASTLYFSSAYGAPSWNYLRDHYRKYKEKEDNTGLVGGGNTPTYTPTAAEMKYDTDGVNSSPAIERLLPVLAKCQIYFSIVAHHAHFPKRVTFHNNQGTPVADNEKFAVPHLVYEPVFTIHNPYDVSLKLDKLRIRIWDPPVKFRFEKINNAPRDGETGGPTPFREGAPFITLGQMQSENQGNANARKAFTFILTDGTPAASGSQLILLPGEVKVFSARVEDKWSWGMETANPYAPRSFFDYQYKADNTINFGNIDERTKGGIGDWGVEAVPGWDARAGLQTDHLSHTGQRPVGSYYDFEKKGSPTLSGSEEFWRGYVSMRLDDTVRVEAKPEIVSAPFTVDILAGLTKGDIQSDVGKTKVEKDLLRRYSFTFDKIIDEVSKDPANSTIDRRFTIDEILQAPKEENPAGKKPFAVLEMNARTTKDELTDNKPWLYNNHLVEGAAQDHRRVGASNQSYDVRFREMTNSFNDFPGIEVDPDTNRGFFGAGSNQAEGGSSFVTMARVPVAPAASLGDLTSANLVAGSNLPRVVHPFGNSRAHPMLEPARVTRSLAGAGTLLDHSYLLNDALWDKYYFSSVADYQEGIFKSGDSRNRLSVLTGILDGTKPALNPRIVPIAAVGDPENTAKEIDNLSANERATQLAKTIGVSGPFNLNSTSVDAWHAVLSSLRDRSVSGWNGQGFANAGRTPFPRATLPVAGAAEGMTDLSSAVGNNVRWAGFRALDDTQIGNLAKSIVEQITLRGAEDGAPPLSIAEFVNRRLGSAGDLHAQAGILQTAIDKSGVNSTNESQDSITLSSSKINDTRIKGASNTAAMDGFSGAGAPSSLTQADLMAALAPIATVRGDTFKIRGYGEALAADGTTVLASAWCEATVQRVPEFVDAANAPETAVDSLNDTNKTFGRRFEIVSFRWLAKSEI